MNGISLLVALAAVGVDVGWEAGPTGQLHYTIRIEKVLLEPLREGQAVVSAVDKNDRSLRRFQVMLRDTDARALDRQTGVPADSIEYGWRPNEDGGIDYLIQISPERLESLANGIPIRGQILSEVTDIRRFYIFAGVGKLPRENPAPAASNAPEPPQFLRDGSRNIGRTSGQAESGGLAAPAGTSNQFTGSGQQAGPNQGGQFANGGNQGQGTSNTGSNLGNWQGANQWSNVNGQGAGGQGAGGQGAGGQGAGGQGAGGQGGNLGNWTNTNDAGNASLTLAQQQQLLLQQQQLQQQQLQQQQANAQNYQANLSQQSLQQPLYPGQGLAQQGYGPTWQTALIQQQAAAAAAAATPAVTPASTNAIPTPASSAGTEKLKETEPPWTPLILTTLALFASLGANAYLGWLAWSFFWRFRDAASDVIRVRNAA